MSAKALLCTSQNGVKIYYDPINSHTATHFDDTPQLKQLVIDILSVQDLDGTHITGDFDMGKIIGTSDVVEIDDTDELLFAKRRNRDAQGLVPFTKSRTAADSSYVSLALYPELDGSYELASAWIGKWASPPFPQMENAEPDSVAYWNAHAFVWGSQDIIPGSETAQRPW